MGGQIHRRLLWLTVLIATAVAPCFALGQSLTTEEGPGSPSKPAGLRVFTAGHSLHWYVPGIITELASAYGVKDHNLVGVQSLGVSRTIQHWNHGGGRNRARQALEKGEVDVFTMSPIPSVLKNARRPQWNNEKFNRALQELAWKTVINYPPSGVKAPAKEN